MEDVRFSVGAENDKEEAGITMGGGGMTRGRSGQLTRGGRMDYVGRLLIIGKNREGQMTFIVFRLVPSEPDS